MCFLEVCKYIVIENKISIYINDDKEIFFDDSNDDASHKERDKK